MPDSPYEYTKFQGDVAVRLFNARQRLPFIMVGIAKCQCCGNIKLHSAAWNATESFLRQEMVEFAHSLIRAGAPWLVVTCVGQDVDDLSKPAINLHVISHRRNELFQGAIKFNEDRWVAEAVSSKPVEVYKDIGAFPPATAGYAGLWDTALAFQN